MENREWAVNKFKNTKVIDALNSERFVNEMRNSDMGPEYNNDFMELVSSLIKVIDDNNLEFGDIVNFRSPISSIHCEFYVDDNMDIVESGNAKYLCEVIIRENSYSTVFEFLVVNAYDNEYIEIGENDKEYTFMSRSILLNYVNGMDKPQMKEYERATSVPTRLGEFKIVNSGLKQFSMRVEIVDTANRPARRKGLAR